MREAKAQNMPTEELLKEGLEQSGGSALENSFSGPNCLPTPMRLMRVKIG